jgi:hypothetical protein
MFIESAHGQGAVTTTIAGQSRFATDSQKLSTPRENCSGNPQHFGGIEIAVPSSRE